MRFRLRIAVLAALLLALLPATAAAHVPIFIGDPPGAVNPKDDTITKLDDANTSWSIYGRFSKAGQTHVVRGPLRKGAPLHVELLLAASGSGDATPTISLSQDGRGQDVPTLPAPEHFHEPFTGTDYVVVDRFDATSTGGDVSVTATATGPARYVIIIGTKEGFGVKDLPAMPGIVRDARAWSRAIDPPKRSAHGTPHSYATGNHSSVVWDQRYVTYLGLARAIVALAALFLLLWILAIAVRDNSIVDIAWGPAFVVVAVAVAGAAPEVTSRAALVDILVAVWALRLATHILARKRSVSRGEDWRYAAWREQWGRLWPLRSLLQVFMLQGLLVLICATPVMIANSAPPVSGRLLGVAGTVIWAFGFAFEAIGDLQLARHMRRRAAGERLPRFIDTGLWRYTRHPNYFGEAVLWWGIAIIVLPVHLGWVGLLGPLTVTTLVRFVSGVPILERRWRGQPAWEEYAARTPVFVPWPRRRPATPPAAGGGVPPRGATGE